MVARTEPVLSVMMVLSSEGNTAVNLSFALVQLETVTPGVRYDHVLIG